MHKIDTPGATLENLFVTGNPIAGILSTIIGHEWLNDVQMELSNTVTASGQSLQKGVQIQLLQAIAIITDAQVNVLLGREIVVVAPSDLIIDQFFGIGDMWGTAKAAALNGTNVTMVRMGPKTLIKKAPEAFSFGDTVYWDTALQETTIDGTGANKKRIGLCAGDELAAAVTVSVLLSGESTPVS